MKTKAAVLFEIGRPLEIVEIGIPVLLEGQVLIKILYSGVCRSQLMEVRGERGADPWLPHLLGHEASGVVVDVGPGVKKVVKGDEVILGWIKSQGINAPGAQYMYRDIKINSGGVTTFSEFSVVSENRIVKKPKNLAFDEAVLFGCALPTGAGMVINQLQPSPDSEVAVLGLGGIGLSALHSLKGLGVKNIVAIDRENSKLQYAKEIGVDHVFNSNNMDEFWNKYPNGIEACIESAGSCETIELGFSILRKSNSKLIFASHPEEGKTISLHPHELICGKQICGSWGGGTQPDRDIPKFVSILENQPLNKLLERRYSLEQVNQALEDMEKTRVFRPLLVMDHS